MTDHIDSTSRNLARYEEMIAKADAWIESSDSQGDMQYCDDPRLSGYNYGFADGMRVMKKMVEEWYNASD